MLSNVELAAAYENNKSAESARVPSVYRAVARMRNALHPWYRAPTTRRHKQTKRTASDTDPQTSRLPCLSEYQNVQRFLQQKH